MDNFGCVELRDPEDVVRNPIIKIIEETFDGIENGKQKQVLLKG